MVTEALLLFVLPALLIAAAVWDVTSFTIPNGLQLALIAGFVLLALCHPMSAGEVGWHLLAGFIGLAIGFTLFALGFVGGGDAKLFACVTLWLGMSDLLGYALISSVFGGFLTLLLIALRKWPLPRYLNDIGWIARLHDARSGIPYGAALAAGAFFMLSQTEIFRTAIGV